MTCLYQMTFKDIFALPVIRIVIFAVWTVGVYTFFILYLRHEEAFHARFPYMKYRMPDTLFGRVLSNRDKMKILIVLFSVIFGIFWLTQISIAERGYKYVYSPYLKGEYETVEGMVEGYEGNKVEESFTVVIYL